MKPLKLDFSGMVRSLKGFLGKPIAGPDTDPARFFARLIALPNPDPILRGLGDAERVYYSIMSDSHVMGDVRSIRGNFRSHAYRLLAGDEGDSKSLAALELCEQWMERCVPSPTADWLDTMWQMSSSFLVGYMPHEPIWTLQSGKYLPEQLLDRPQRRFRFNAAGEPLLISKANPMGVPVEPFQFIISRHMADSTQPYGRAVLASCFWPWTFKNGGWKYFVRYCERFGLPWPIGRYPLGTTDEAQDDFAEALANMVDGGFAVVPEGNAVEILVPNGNGAGGLPQQNLIDLCNREMSKALTGQAMVAELQGAGARAASETALKRQESIDDSVRDIAALSMGTLFRWITLFNFGDGVAPPRLEFYEQVNQGKDRAETYEIASRMGARPSRSAMLEELGIPEAEDDDDALVPQTPTQPVVDNRPNGPKGDAKGQPGTTPGGDDGKDPSAQLQLARFLAALATQPGLQFAQQAGMTDEDAQNLAAEAADEAIAQGMLAPIAQMLASYEAQGKTLAEFNAALSEMVGVLDEAALRGVVERALKYSLLRGAATQAP